jgi:hypothetical protein
MVIESSVSGFFRTILIVIGFIVLLRFIGQLMNAKRNLEEEKRLKEELSNYERDQKKSKVNFGKTSILNSNLKKSATSPIEDVDYEELV